MIFVRRGLVDVYREKTIIKTRVFTTNRIKYVKIRTYKFTFHSVGTCNGFISHAALLYNPDYDVTYWKPSPKADTEIIYRTKCFVDNKIKFNILKFQQLFYIERLKKYNDK